jgi:glycosyltransferase involved in cell wall biosynthesis
MRVLFVCTALESHGGIQRFNRNLVQALADLGVQLDVVIVADEAGLNSQFGELVTLHGAGGSKLRWAGSVLSLLMRRRYDRCICGHLHLAAPFAAMLRLFGYARSRGILVLHGIEVWNRVVGARRRGAQGFGRVLAVSSYTAKSFIDQIRGFPRDTVTIFPNAISPGLFAGPMPEANPRAEAAVFKLLSVTRLSQTERDKGIADVLDAVAALSKTVAIRYVIVGDGDYRGILEDRARSLGIESRVEFAGALSDAALWAMYARSDVFVLPSAKEGFGIVFLEAMRFGLPVIGASEKGALDVIRHDVNGLLVDYGDVAALSRALGELAIDSARRYRLGAAGKSLVERGGQFSFEAFRSRCEQWIVAA